MKRITFNTPPSCRTHKKASLLIKGAWSVAARLNSKSRAVHGEIESSKEAEIISKLKALKCTCIKTELIEV